MFSGKPTFGNRRRTVTTFPFAMLDSTPNTESRASVLEVALEPKLNGYHDPDRHGDRPASSGLEAPAVPGFFSKRAGLWAALRPAEHRGTVTSRPRRLTLASSGRDLGARAGEPGGKLAAAKGLGILTLFLRSSTRRAAGAWTASTPGRARSGSPTWTRRRGGAREAFRPRGEPERVRPRRRRWFSRCPRDGPDLPRIAALSGDRQHRRAHRRAAWRTLIDVDACPIVRGWSPTSAVW
jgi:hypothetical protein